MDDRDWLAERFEQERPRLKGVAYRMLGSLSEAEDALQDAWLRVSRAGAGDVRDVRAWLTTIVARVCLNALRARRTRAEEPLEVHLADPVISPEDDTNPEQQALLADAVGLALYVVLDALTPAERLAFVLHDMFDLPFHEIAPMVDRSPQAARQLASRARRRVQGAALARPDPDLRRQRQVVDAFFAAARQGDLQALVSVLDPNVVLRGDGGRARPHQTVLVRGAEAVAAQARAGADPNAEVRPVLVNGAAGALILGPRGPVAVLAFTVTNGTIVEIDALTDPQRLARLDLAALDAQAS